MLSLILSLLPFLLMAMQSSPSSSSSSSSSYRFNYGGGVGNSISAEPRQCWCHMCSRTISISPSSGDLICPNCNSWFVEELEDQIPNPNICHQCERTVSISPSSGDLICPNCNGSFVEELENPIPTPNTNPIPPFLSHTTDFPSAGTALSSFSYRFTYDVFLSFRGSDTRYGFTGNLYRTLHDSGIRTFIDDRDLQGGDEITPSLFRAIEESRIFIPVFSNNYAFSSFCLDELVHIIHCFKAKGRLVLPVFYDVDPSHVRHQIGSYGEAIAKHEERFQNKYTHLINILLVLFLLPFLLYPHGSAITLLLLLLPIFLLQNNNEDYTDNRKRLQKWKMALNQAANFSGHHFNPRIGYEYEFVRDIVKEVSNKINCVPLHVEDYPGGLESRVLQVKSRLGVEYDGVVPNPNTNPVPPFLSHTTDFPASGTALSSFSYGFSYHVFLSFRGTDTCYGFTGNLFKALDGNGIRTFIDDRELHGGDEITPSLLKAIEESRIFIPIFSINYASSSFCLDELVHIMECSKAKGRLVLPVFYGVDPSHVRHQTETGGYGKALVERVEKFQKNKEKYADKMKRLQKWKMALEQVVNLSGYHFKIGNEHEHEFIGSIVKYVSNKISRVPLHVADYPVGLESRVLHVKSLLDERSDDGVHIIGIYGIGGVGKTTLAKAIYNFIADQFECLCFLHNVRENSAKHLHEMLFSKTVGLDIKLGDASEGIPTIKQRLHRKKVLLILDDVDKLEQLQVLAGGLDWFGLGSKVIITTRNKHLLASHGIKRTYELDELNGEEALEILRWKAFKSDKVDPCYEDILNRAVTYASGLPLALEVVGSDLFGKPIEHCESVFDRYKKIPNEEIQKILKVSFDALGKEEQSVFLDIACCFKGHRLAEVEDILHAHYGHNMKYHIGVLVEKSLIKIDKLHVTLHDLIEDMGKEIVRQESPIEPGKRSRLWFGEDIVHVLQENTGTSKIEIMYLDCPSIEVVLNRKAFKKMKNLKTLVIESGHFSEGPTHFPSSLRVLVWKRYPSQFLPSNFRPEKLAICNLYNSRLTSFELTSSLNKTSRYRRMIRGS